MPLFLAAPNYSSGTKFAICFLIIHSYFFPSSRRSFSHICKWTKMDGLPVFFREGLGSLTRTHTHTPQTRHIFGALYLYQASFFRSAELHTSSMHLPRVSVVGVILGAGPRGSWCSVPPPTVPSPDKHVDPPLHNEVQSAVRGVALPAKEEMR